MRPVIPNANSRIVLLAGLAGGTAEILWITAYGSATTVNGATVARQVTASLWPAAAEWAWAPALGIMIHLVLSIALVAMTAPLLSRVATKSSGAGFILMGATSMLALVWTVNFFIILPVINPTFVTLMPYGISLVSKLLFGVTLGVVLYLMPLRDAGAVWPAPAKKAPGNEAVRVRREMEAAFRGKRA